MNVSLPLRNFWKMENAKIALITREAEVVLEENVGLTAVAAMKGC